MTEQPLRPVRRTWDVVLAIVLLALLVVLAAVLGFGGAFLVMASDSCGSGGTSCDDGRLSAGVLVAMLGPAVVTVVAIISVVERLVRSRLAFWPALVGVVVSVLVWTAGAALAFSGVPGLAR